jgi:tetratricopeptide (TPR) repeat protein
MNRFEKRLPVVGRCCLIAGLFVSLLGVGPGGAADFEGERYAELIRTALEIKNDASRRMILTAIPVLQARGDSIDGALASAAKIPDLDSKAVALARIAMDRVTIRDANGAMRAFDVFMEVGAELLEDIGHGPDAYALAIIPQQIAQLQAAEARDHLAAGDIAAAIEATERILEGKDDEWLSDVRDLTKSEVLVEIVLVQVGKGDIAGASGTAERISDSDLRGEADVAITEGRAEAGDVAAAMAAVDKMEAKSKPQALATIAIAQGKAGDGEGAKRVIDAAYEAAGNAGYYEEVEALLSIGRIQVEAGDMEGARRTYDRAVAREAINRATSVMKPRKFEGERSDVLVAIALARVEKGDLAGASGAADEIPLPHRRSEAVIEIAGGHAKAGDLAAAMAEVEKVGPEFKSKALAAIAMAQWKAGDGEGAEKSINAAYEGALNFEPKKAGIDEGGKLYRTREYGRIEALLSIARIQLEAGDREGARRTFARVASTIEKNQGSAGVDQERYKRNKLFLLIRAQSESGEIEGALRTVD